MNIRIGNICQTVIHRVGNKNNSEGIYCSESLSDISGIEEMLMKLIKNSFSFNSSYCFQSIDELTLNPSYVFVSRIFEDNDSLINNSKFLARYLYDCSIHPNIKNGEFYTLTLKHCFVEDEETDAIALLKTETKHSYIYTKEERNAIIPHCGIGTDLKHLDKGCIIFNLNKSSGYIMFLVDNANRGNDAKYWTESFLHAVPRSDSYNQTAAVLTLHREFIASLDGYNKLEKSEMLQRSVEALKSENVVLEEVEKVVFPQHDINEHFEAFKKQYIQNTNIKIEDQFTSSSKAIEKQKTALKRMHTICLDGNVDIIIHNDGSCIERGYDDYVGMNYYKIYFKKEK